MGTWSLTGSRLAVRAFLFPRIDGLSRKRGSTGAEEERNYFWDSAFVWFSIFGAALCSVFFLGKVLTECFFTGSLNVRRCPSVPLFIPPCLPDKNYSLHPLSCCVISYLLVFSLLFPYASATSISSSPSSPLPLSQLGWALPWHPLLHIILCFHLLTSH